MKKKQALERARAMWGDNAILDGPSRIVIDKTTGKVRVGRYRVCTVSHGGFLIVRGSGCSWEQAIEDAQAQFEKEKG